MQNLKVATYNIWAGRNNIEPQTRNYNWTAEVITEIAPDIIGLQEVGKQPCCGFPPCDFEEEVPDFLGKKTGMYAYYAPALWREGYGYGNAILSKYPIRTAKTVNIPKVRPEDEQRCVLVAEIDACGGITVLVTHFGLSPEEHTRGVETVLTLTEAVKTPVIFMGDLNIMPENEILRPLFERFTDTAGGALQPYTWPSAFTKYTGISEKEYGMNKERKVDYIFTSSHFITRNSATHPSLASDHVPFVANLKL